MRSAHTVEQVRAAEESLMATLPEGVLMDRAATGLAHAVLELLGSGYGARVHLLVGSGANGGDALFAGAALLRRGAAVDAQLLAPDRTHGAGLRAFRAAGGQVVDGPG
ncbi:MAG: NAD(P)H-hydrate epimerase, partial [Nocardioides sp.]